MRLEPRREQHGTMILVLTEAYEVFIPTIEATKLENKRPPTPKQRKKEQHHPTFMFQLFGISCTHNLMAMLIAP